METERGGQARLHDDGWGVSRQRGPGREDAKRRNEMRPAAVMADGAPDQLPGDMHPLGAVSAMLVVPLQASL